MKLLKSIKAVALVTMIAVPAFTAHANPGKVLKWVAAITAGTAAAKSAANADEADSFYKEQLNIIQALKQKGIPPDNTSISSFYFSLDGNVSSVMWADIFNKPDIFATVEIEGHGRYIVPIMQYEYTGQPIMENLITEKIRPGSRILIHILDDDTLSDTIWNNILQTRIDCRISADVACTKMSKVHIEASGKIRLLDKNVVVAAPDMIATAEFRAPELPGSTGWRAAGPLFDSSNRKVGELHFAKIWEADRQDILAAEEAVRKASRDAAVAHSKKIFWSIMGGVFILVTVAVLISKSTTAS